jgi:ethanolamine ammonia-lyase small subunit
MTETRDTSIDPWSPLRRATPARIGLGRSGVALKTRDMLAFDMACARARDAVAVELDVAGLAGRLAPRACIAVHSQAGDRAAFLQRPDLGRRLRTESADRLGGGPHDLVVVIADGLSSTAVEHHAPDVLDHIAARLGPISLGPVVIAAQGRVALADEIGEQMQARAVAILIGERPGLTAPDSLGIYLTIDPRRGRSDADRNCISNIHGGGLTAAAAASKLIWLLNEGLRLGFSGVDLKDQEHAVVPAQHGKRNDDGSHG